MITMKAKALHSGIRSGVQFASRTVARVVQFLSDFWWFLRHWNPVSIRWNSPRWNWRLAMSRAAIAAAYAEGRAKIDAEAKADAEAIAESELNPTGQATVHKSEE